MWLSGLGHGWSWRGGNILLPLVVHGLAVRDHPVASWMLLTSADGSWW